MLVSKGDADAHNRGFKFFVFGPNEVFLVLGPKQEFHSVLILVIFLFNLKFSLKNPFTKYFLHTVFSYS
jgi:hypothetical protein